MSRALCFSGATSAKGSLGGHRRSTGPRLWVDKQQGRDEPGVPLEATCSDTVRTVGQVLDLLQMPCPQERK